MIWALVTRLFPVISTLNPATVQRVMTITIMLLVLSATFAAGWFLGSRLTEDKCQIELNKQMITHLEKQADTLNLVVELDKRHRVEREQLERSLSVFRKTLDASIAEILKTNPEVRKWYESPINDVEHAAMYGTVDGLQNGTRGVRQPTPTH
jgi:hypothetical protein